MTIKNDENEITKEVLCYLHDLIVDNLQKEKLTVDESRAMAVDIIENIANDFGGNVIYIPRCHYEKIWKKWNEIYDLWRVGESVKDLSRAYQISLVQTYKIIREVKAKRTARRQRN